MKYLYKNLINRLKDASKLAFMGIGEEKLSDDGVGPYIISELLDLSSDKFLFLNAGIDPMARINDLVKFKPSHLILIDTCTLDKAPGTVAILERDKIVEYVPISSHTIPIHIVIDLIVDQVPGLEVFMIGFVPESLEGFKDLKLYKGDKTNFNDLDKNIDLPFFEINLTKKIQQAALEVIKIIKKLVKELET